MLFNISLLTILACGEVKDTASSDDTGSSFSQNNNNIEGIECTDNVCILSGTITEDLTLTKDTIYLLRGGVYIGNDTDSTVLTIEAGTTIYGESSTDGMLIVRRYSQIMAEGTAEEPIVFTSSKEPGSRARGDWGGLIINGNAPINACADEDSFCEAFGEGGTGFYGGTDSADDSGVLKYVRVEFAGTLVSPENELNGIAFQGVGSSTEVDYIQVHMNADDGIEFFGGSVVVKHVLVTSVGDDSLDWTDGWTGGAQFVILHQSDDNGDNGIEADNNAENNDATPRSMPTLSNLSIIGSPDSERSDFGVLLREGSAAILANSLVVGFNEACLSMDHDATFTQLDAGNVTITNSVLNCAINFESSNNMDLETWFLHQEGNALGRAELKDAYNLTSPDYSPNSTGDAIPVDASTLYSSFDSTDFVGAIGSEDWTAGWTTYERN